MVPSFAKNHKNLYFARHLFQFNFSPPSLENHFCTSKTFFSFSFDDSIHFCLALGRTLTRSHWEICPKFSLICLLSIINLRFHGQMWVWWSHKPWNGAAFDFIDHRKSMKTQSHIISFMNTAKYEFWGLVILKNISCYQTWHKMKHEMIHLLKNWVLKYGFCKKIGWETSIQFF